MEFTEQLLAIQNLRKKGQSEKALLELDSINSKARSVPGFYYLKGCLYQDLGEVDRAHKCYLKEVRSNRHLFQAHINRGVLFFEAGKIPEAIACTKLAMLVAPLESLPYFNLGNLMRFVKRLKEAVLYYQKAVAIDSSYLDAWRNLASVYRSIDETDKAVTAYQQILKLDPSCKVTQYLLRALEGKSPKGAPKVYVESLFDTYSVNYDSHLIGSLDYSCHRILSEFVLPSDNFIEILDLGCGTGLCAEAFGEKGPAKQKWFGVDISEKMLKLAKEKNRYEELHCLEIGDYLNHENRIFDLIVVGDVLPYFGCLSNLLAGIKARLANKGVLLFSTELYHGGEGYKLNKYGRFQHSEDYVFRLVKSHGLMVEEYKFETIRSNDDIPVVGGLYRISQP